jgi:site-specific recombinase
MTAAIVASASGSANNGAIMPVLAHLLARLDPQAPLVERNLCLIALLDWIRGNASRPQPCVERVEYLLDVLDRNPPTRLRFQQWWQQLTASLDASTLLADFGFASRNTFLSECIERLQRKVLPGTPQTQDSCELFALAMPKGLDALWIGELGDTTCDRLASLLSVPARPGRANYVAGASGWQCALLDAITYCTSQVRAAGFAPDLRLRMVELQNDASPFLALAASLGALREAWLNAGDTQEAAQQFKVQLERCRSFAASAYSHLDSNGISLDLVFSLRQLRERVMRIRSLLDCLLYDSQQRHSARLLSQLVLVGQERSSVSALLRSTLSLLAVRVVEHHSLAGEHYIARNRAEHRSMLRQAIGGGALTAFTTAAKFAVMALGLASFWYGFWSGVVYAASFLAIALLHFTLATKQPAMTAAAMAAKLRDMDQPHSLDAFVDEVSFLVRTQVAAVLGNVVAVFPVVIVLSLVLQAATAAPMIGPETARHVLHSLSLRGPSLIYAAFTGVLLFASAMIAGWVENWFVLHRLDSALRYHPRITRRLGPQRAERMASFVTKNISVFASNISLGFLLGLVPAVLAFFAVSMEVRHVTLSTGQLAAACASLGWAVLDEPEFWWVLACLPAIGALNLGVSFYLALRVALRAHNVGIVGRSAIGKAIWRRLKTHPASFFWPQRQDG